MFNGPQPEQESRPKIPFRSRGTLVCGCRVLSGDNVTLMSTIFGTSDVFSPAAATEAIVDGQPSAASVPAADTATTAVVHNFVEPTPLADTDPTAASGLRQCPAASTRARPQYTNIPLLLLPIFWLLFSFVILFHQAPSELDSVKKFVSPHHGGREVSQAKRSHARIPCEAQPTDIRNGH